MAPSATFQARALPSDFSAFKAKKMHSQKLRLDSQEVSANAEPLVAVIGVGFVGTGLVDSFSSKYNVMGFDISNERLDVLRQEFRMRPNVSFTSMETDLKKATHFLVSVPTLLRKDKSIDLSYLRSALRKIELYARRGSTVVIESSVAIGLTRELLGPIASSRGLFAGMSPEVCTIWSTTS